MFNYFGSKATLARTYQPPEHDVIVEPFAGSAQYAMYWMVERPSVRCVLYDTDPMVIASWHRMLDATPDEIAAWTINIGDPVEDYVDLANFGGGNRVANERIVTRFYQSRNRWASVRAAVGDRVEIVEGSYEAAPNIDATWFIDPPYQKQGKLYVNGSGGIDFRSLGEWCRTRNGQTIVCEAAPADWLPFTHHKSSGSLGNTDNRELVWYSDPELKLFT